MFYIIQDKGLGEALEKIEGFNSQGLKLCELLREQKIRADVTINSATNFLRLSLFLFWTFNDICKL